MDPVELTRALLAYNTTNPPGAEAACGQFIAGVLEQHGYAVERQPFDGDRLNLIARVEGSDSDAAPLILTGHIDTVPLGAAPWSVDPFVGETSDGRLYGRGVSDMKSGVAAMMVAAVGVTQHRARLKRGLTLIFTSGEETGCAGALQLANANRLGRASAMIVGEPTGNRISTGHKGCVAVRVRARGITTHSSMPEKGVNAIYRAARAVVRVESFRFAEHRDPLLGRPSINVGMIAGGLNYNSVPDAANFTIDVRSIPQLSHDEIQANLARHLGTEVELERFVDMPAVATNAADPFVETLQRLVSQVLGPNTDTASLGLPFFSDASVFHPHFRCPTLLFGPGEPAQAHQTDEYCLLHKIGGATAVYEALIGQWCGSTFAPK